VLARAFRREGGTTRLPERRPGDLDPIASHATLSVAEVEAGA
jgi:hypothetical protein